MDEVEGRALGAVQARWEHVVTQDLVCLKCQLIKRGRLSPFCECGGPLALTHGAATSRRRLRALRRLGKYHGMETLAEYCEWLLGVGGVHPESNKNNNDDDDDDDDDVEGEEEEEEEEEEEDGDGRLGYGAAEMEDFIVD